MENFREKFSGNQKERKDAKKTEQKPKKTRAVDLYKTIFSGQDDDIILRPNDKIFVGGIGNVVALKNGVSVTGIYETKFHCKLLILTEVFVII